MKKYILPVVLMVVLLSCDKDKFKTEPQIKIDSYSTKVLQRNQDLVIQLNFTDKEGDLAGGKFTYIPKRLNRRPPPPNVNYRTITIPVPQFPTSDDGEFELRLPWNILHLSDLENDTLFFRFTVEDRGGNKSDTIDSDQIVILRQ